jgi:hypothetical protein
MYVSGLVRSGKKINGSRLFQLVRRLVHLEMVSNNALSIVRRPDKRDKVRFIRTGDLRSIERRERHAVSLVVKSRSDKDEQCYDNSHLTSYRISKTFPKWTNHYSQIPRGYG